MDYVRSIARPWSRRMRVGVLLLVLGVAALLRSEVALSAIQDFDIFSAGETFPLAPIARQEPFTPFHLMTLPALWVTVLDKHAKTELGAAEFKRHMISKHIQGKIAWEQMAVLATADAPSSLREWATSLGVSVQDIGGLSCDNNSGSRERLSRVQAWCRSGHEHVVYMDTNTIVLGDVRELPALCRSNGDFDFCGTSASSGLPAFTIDTGVFVVKPSDDQCNAFTAKANAAAGNDHEMCDVRIINEHIDLAHRSIVDFRYNVIDSERRPTHQLKNAFVIQYDSAKPSGSLRTMLTDLDRMVGNIEAQLAGHLPKRVLYATLLTPKPETEETHSVNNDWLIQHHVSLFVNGKIPWEQQAFIYTDDALPEFRKWLEDRGGKTIEVDPLLCHHPNRQRWKYQFTKFQLWGLTEYDTIVYTDLDTVFLRDARNMWASCPGGIFLCGVSHSSDFPRKHDLNGGVFIIRPNHDFHQALLQAHEALGDTGGCEQDFVNKVLTSERFGEIDPKYNAFSHDMARKSKFNDAIVVHIDKREPHLTPEDRKFIDQFFVDIMKVAADMGL